MTDNETVWTHSIIKSHLCTSTTFKLLILNIGGLLNLSLRPSYVHCPFTFKVWETKNLSNSWKKTFLKFLILILTPLNNYNYLDQLRSTMRWSDNKVKRCLFIFCLKLINIFQITIWKNIYQKNFSVLMLSTPHVYYNFSYFILDKCVLIQYSLIIFFVDHNCQRLSPDGHLSGWTLFNLSGEICN